MIRQVARELYQLQQEVDRLESRLKEAPGQEKEEIQEQLRKLRAERDKIRRILEGKKEPSPFRRPR